MDDSLPSITSGPGTVGSRFVSQDEIDSAKSRRDEQWQAAYARIGQVPPARPTEDVYDGRSLAEKLAANKIAKQEEWEEKTKLANQFRALEEDEVLFLDSMRDEQEKKELKRKLDDAEEVKGFMEAVAARNSLPEKLPTSTSPTLPTPAKAKPKVTQPAVKKSSSMKNSIKGVIVKKKSSTGKTAASSGPAPVKTDAKDTKESKDFKSETTPKTDSTKRRKLSSPSS